MSEATGSVATPERIDRYRVISELGRGSMGRVYLAHDPNTDRRVALKVRTGRPDQEAEEEESSRSRFLLEGRAAGRLQHPGIVVVYDADTDAATGQAFLAMEWVEGQSLAALIKRRGPLPWATAARIAGEVASALDHAHERGVVHRDVKPENILIGVDGRVKVSDFGIAKVIAAEPRTLAGEVLGTPHYMSPEQLRSDPLDGRSDLFSLGAVLYEMLAGVPPFPGDTIASVTYKIAWVDPQPPSIARDDLPASLEKIVLRLLAKAPDERYARGREVADALAAVIADPGETSRTATLPVPAEPRPSPDRAGAGRGRTRLLRGVAILALTGLAATAILLWSRSAPSATAPDPAPAAQAPPPAYLRAADARELADAVRPEDGVATPESPPEPPVDAASGGARKPRASSSGGGPSDLAQALAAIPAPFSTSGTEAPPASPEAQPATASAPAPGSAHLVVTHHNRLRGGWMTIWIDGRRVWSRELRAPPNVLDRITGEDLRIELPVAPGEHEVEVRVAHVKARIDSGGIATGSFQDGQTRVLEVTLVPYVPRLGMSWED